VDFDRLDLAASDERERSEEEVVRVDHWLTPLDSAGAAVASTAEESWTRVGTVEVRSVSPLLAGRRR
jgi:hypothetical protein